MGIYNSNGYVAKVLEGEWQGDLGWEIVTKGRSEVGWASSMAVNAFWYAYEEF